MDGYPRAEASFLSEGDLNHSPILVHFFDLIQGKPMFKFCHYWALKPNSLEVVERVWHEQITGHMCYQIHQKLLALKHELKK